jgi:hypothetical protein
VKSICKNIIATDDDDDVDMLTATDAMLCDAFRMPTMVLCCDMNSLDYSPTLYMYLYIVIYKWQWWSANVVGI